MATISIGIEEIADSIKHMKKNELEVLTLILSKESEELLSRKKEIESGTDQSLTRDEVFDV